MIATRRVDEPLVLLALPALTAGSFETPTDKQSVFTTLVPDEPV
jgi:hypothetical protein